MLRPDTKPARKMDQDDLLLVNSYAFAPVTVKKLPAFNDAEGNRCESILLT